MFFADFGEAMALPGPSVQVWLYRGTSLIKNNPLLGPYSRTMSRATW